MIHYSCDLCHRRLDPDDLRYVVRIEVYAALDPVEEDEEVDDHDHLLQVQEALERECLDHDGADHGGLADETDEVEADDWGESYQDLRFDLCADCRKKFAKDPLGRHLIGQFNFSEN